MLLDLNSDLVPDLLKFMSESTPIPKVHYKQCHIKCVVAVQRGKKLFMEIYVH